MEIIPAEQVAEADPADQVLQPGPDTSFHVTLLAIAAAVIALSFLLRVEGEQQVVLPLVNLPLPGVCTSQRFLGLDCPGCGLTRSFVSIGHGDLHAAWHFNPAGILGFAVVATQIPYRAAQWIRIRRGHPELKLNWLGQLLLWTFFLLLLIQWSIRLVTG